MLSRIAIAGLPDDVSLWRVRCLAGQVVDAGGLSQSEQRRAASLPISAQRQRYIVSRIALRQLLQSEFGLAKDQMIVERSGFKPYLEGVCGIDFSLSHLGDESLIVLSSKRAVGVDWQADDVRIDREAIAETFFSATEAQRLSLASGQEGKALFLRSWVLREALYKCSGCDFMQLADMDVASLTQQGLAIVESGIYYHLKLAPIDNHWLAVCWGN